MSAILYTVFTFERKIQLIRFINLKLSSSICVNLAALPSKIPVL